MVDALVSNTCDFTVVRVRVSLPAHNIGSNVFKAHASLHGPFLFLFFQKGGPALRIHFALPPSPTNLSIPTFICFTKTHFMKQILLLLLLLPIVSRAQTPELEELQLKDGMRTQQWSYEQAQERKRQWQKIKPIYPALPYDSVRKEVALEKTIAFPGLSKAIAFKRVKEWCNIEFADSNPVIRYEDLESGKIILEGYKNFWYSSTLENFWGTVKFSQEERKVLFTLVVTLKDEKAKLAFRNLKYRYAVPGYVASNLNYYVPPQEFSYSLSSTLPLVKAEPDSWKGIIEQLNSTMKALQDAASDMERYLLETASDGQF